MKRLLHTLSLLFILSFALTGYAQDNAQDLEANCRIEDGGLSDVNVVGARSTGNGKVECTLSCNFDARSEGENNVKQSFPPEVSGEFIKEVDIDGTTEITFEQIRNNCCGVRGDVCFLNGECYVAEDPSSCSAGAIGLGASNQCAVETSDGETSYYDDEEDCDCPPGEELLEKRGRLTVCKEIPEEPDLSCNCPSDLVLHGEEIVCEIPEIEETVEHEHRGDMNRFNPELPEYEQEVECNYQGCRPDQIISNGECVSLSCSCPNDRPFEYDEEVECDIEPIGETATHQNNGEESFTYDHDGQDIRCDYSSCLPGERRSGDRCVQIDQDYECSCPGEFFEGDTVECQITSEDDEEVLETVSHRYDGSSDVFKHSYQGEDLPCSFQGADPLSCNCVSTSQARVFNCHVYQGGSDTGEMHQVQIGDYHGETIYEDITTESGQDLTCEIRVPSGCDIDDSQVGDGVCYTGCRSWEDPDCDYGRSGRRALDLAFNALGLSTPQEFWNKKLNDDGVIGKLYSVLDNIPGSPEWLTNQVCRANIQVDDETACDLVGLEGEDCEEIDEPWGGGSIFQDDDTINLAARYVRDLGKSYTGLGDSAGKYRIRWTVNGVEDDAEMRIFLANIEHAGAYENFNLLPQDQKIIYPDKGDYAEVSSSTYEYTSSQEFSHVCMLFRVDDADVRNRLMDSLDAIGRPFTCRKVLGN